MAHKEDKDYSFGAVPRTDRKSFWSMFFVMLGFTFFSSSMSVGASLGNGMGLAAFGASVLIGSLILSVYTGFLGYIGSKTGLSFDQLGQRTFGKKGSILSSIVVSITQIGWFGVGVAMFSNCVAEVLGINRIVVMIAAGACMTASAYFGIKGMEIISYISVPLITVLGVISMVKATTEGGGLTAIFAQNAGDITLVTGISLVIGSFVSGGTTTPNFTRFAKSEKIAVITTVIAFFIVNILMYSFGAVGGAFSGKDDIFYVMMAQGLLVPALLVLGANIWTTNDNTLYSAGLGLSNITGISKRPLVVAAGAIGTLASIWIYDHFISWLSILNCFLPPIGAVIIADFLLHKKFYLEQDSAISPVKWGSIISVAAGSLVGIFVNVGITGINSMLVSMAVYLVITLLIFRKRT